MAHSMLWPLALYAVVVAPSPWPLTPFGESNAAPSPIIEGMDLLYGERLPVLDSGEPLVTVGIAMGADEIALRAVGRVALEYIEGGLRKQTVVPAGERLHVTLNDPSRAVPALRAHYVDVQGLADVRWATASRALSAWHRRGIGEITWLWDGTRLDLGARPLDTRSRRIVVPMPDAEAWAREATRLGRAFNVVARPLTRLATRPRGDLRVLGQRGIVARPQHIIRAFALDGAPIEVERVPFAQGYAWAGRESRRYRGDIYVAVDPNAHLAVVNAIGIEALLGGVVPAEMYATAPPEALRAQAVAARNTVLAKLGRRHHDAPFQLCAEQHCQVYAGIGAETAATQAAVAQTHGQALFLRGQLVDAVYSSSCGGHTEDNDTAWGETKNPVLRGRPDVVVEGGWSATVAPGLSEGAMADFLARPPPTFCGLAARAHAGADKFRWQHTVPAHVLLGRLAQLHRGIGETLLDVQVAQRGAGGRVVGLRLRGEAATQLVRYELPIRQLLGNINSAAFVLTPQRDPQGRVMAVHVAGGGWGHGVGMCQMGAIGRAAAGHSAEQILAHYYSGARPVTLWRGAEPEGRAVQR